MADLIVAWTLLALSVGVIVGAYVRVLLAERRRDFAKWERQWGRPLLRWRHFTCPRCGRKGTTRATRIEVDLDQAEHDRRHHTTTSARRADA